jgi:hypothetical protein
MLFDLSIALRLRHDLSKVAAPTPRSGACETWVPLGPHRPGSRTSPTGAELRWSELGRPPQLDLGLLKYPSLARFEALQHPRAHPENQGGGFLVASEVEEDHPLTGPFFTPYLRPTNYPKSLKLKGPSSSLGNAATDSKHATTRSVGRTRAQP